MTDNLGPNAGGAGSRLEKLAAYGKQISSAVLTLAAGFAAIALYRAIRFGFGLAFGWLGALAVTAAFVGSLQWVGRENSQLTEGERLRFRLLTLGGALGLLTAVFGLLLPFTVYYETFSGGLKQWRADPAALVWTGLALFGGLALAFVTLQMARGMERSSAPMRRLVYGFNAVLTTLLLAVILGLVNVLAYSRVGPFNFFTTAFDWTTGGVYTLSDGSKALLAGLKQPVKVYVLMNQDDPATPAVETLLNNARGVSDRVSWESFSRDRNRKALGQLLEKYPVSDPYGLLVVYGTDPNTSFDFVKYDDVFSAPAFNPRGGPPSTKYTFKGENALMKSIVYLTEGKTKAVVYFTRGSGELQASGGGRGRDDTSVATLRERIAKANYEVKDLRLGPGGEAAVPADAETVVVARPGGAGEPMSPDAVKALRDYLAGTGRKDKGKLVVLLDVVAMKDGRMVQTGLEGLLSEYGVAVKNDRVLSLRSRNPTAVTAVANFQSRNPVAVAFVQGNFVIPFDFDDARTVEPKPGGGGPYSAETLVQTAPDSLVWGETDLAADPAALVARLRNAPQQEQVAKLRPALEKPISLGVAVSDGGGPDLSGVPGHPPVAGGGKPRMVVFGDATWVTDLALSGRFGDNNYELFSNCLSWLRERPDIGRQAPDKEREDYSLTLSEDQASRVKLLPAGLMLAAVLGLAGGVWVVRRR